MRSLEKKTLLLSEVFVLGLTQSSSRNACMLPVFPVEAIFRAQESIHNPSIRRFEGPLRPGCWEIEFQLSKSPAVP